MTTAQKVIKYLAIAFAICLILGIFASIIAFGQGITEFLVDQKVEEVDVDTYTKKEFETSKVLNIKLAASSLEIKKGEAFKVETNNKEIKIKEENNQILIEEKDKKVIFRKKTPKVILYIPEDLKFDSVKIETGAGKLDVDVIDTESIELSLGAGEAVINSINSNNTKIETGAGELIIKNGKLNNSKIEVGVGKLDIKAEFTGNSKISSGIGSTNIKLLETENNYKLSFEKGIGSIKYNGKSISNDTVIGEGSNFIKIEGGIGSITVSE